MKVKKDVKLSTDLSSAIIRCWDEGEHVACAKGYTMNIPLMLAVFLLIPTFYLFLSLNIERKKFKANM